MRRNLTKTVATLAFVSAMAIGTAAPTMAQVYFEGPGFDIGVGPRWHDRYYYDHVRPYHHYWRHGYDWD
jgi:hypothetical protein